MQRLFAVFTVLLACLLGLPATASAAPAPIGGGSVLFNPAGGRCTVAFAATRGTAGYLIAGPGCATTSSNQLYSGDNVLVGTTAPAPVPPGGPTVVRITNTSAWQPVGRITTPAGTVPVRGSTETPIGGPVCLYDRTTGVRCGTITAKNQTVAFPGGTFSGLTRTNICLSPGSGPIAFLTGDQAQGVPVGGIGSCSSGSSFFQPVNRILAAYGLTLLTG